jgi:hypothetical protein
MVIETTATVIDELIDLHDRSLMRYSIAPIPQLDDPA